LMSTREALSPQHRLPISLETITSDAYRLKDEPRPLYDFSVTLLTPALLRVSRWAMLWLAMRLRDRMCM